MPGPQDILILLVRSTTWASELYTFPLHPQWLYNAEGPGWYTEGSQDYPGARTGLSLGEGESHTEEQRLDVSTRRERLLD